MKCSDYVQNEPSFLHSLDFDHLGQRFRISLRHTNHFLSTGSKVTFDSGKNLNRSLIPNKVDGRALAPESSSSADAMEVGLKVRIPIFRDRDVVIYHQTDIVNVDTTGQNVGGDQDSTFALPEGFHGLISHGVVNSTVQEGAGISLRRQRIVNGIGIILRTDKDN